MDRREFLQTLSVSVGSAVYVQSRAVESTESASSTEEVSAVVALDSYTYLTQFESAGETWKAYEDLRSREGNLVLVSAKNQQRILPKTAEAMSAQGVAPYVGLTLEEVVDAVPDLMAQRILERGGDPDEELVKSAVPPLQFRQSKELYAGTFIGTKECWDTQPLMHDGSTLTFLSAQYCPAIEAALEKEQGFDGLVGGWLPIIRKVFPMEQGGYWEILGFADTEKRERFTVHTWHRVIRVEEGKIAEVFYRHTYRPFPPVRGEVKPEDFYRALLACVDYWRENLREFRPLVLPRKDWADMAKHAFVKELIARPGGVHARYGAVERFYAGSEHDGFPDTFTSAVSANLEWGRFTTAKAFIENYFDEFVEASGALNYRGPETGQYGLMLALMAKYYRYTGDESTLLKYQDKLSAIAGLLTQMHEESLKLPMSAPGHGFLHGWSEADECLSLDPDLLWRPYFGNTALAVRGFKDLGAVWAEMAKTTGHPELADQGRRLTARSRQLQQTLITGIERSVRTDRTPPSVGAFAGAEHPFVDGDLSSDAGTLRSFMELLQADVLPPKLATSVIDCLRAYGGNTLGVPGALRDVKNQERSLVGFVTPPYAQTLLRLGRAEEFLLFLYAHRYHIHQRGHWTAREAAGISRRPDTYVDPYCTPAQQGVPLLLRWMLVLEDSDEERLYLGRGIPRSWIASGQEISLQQAPTRWGGVSLSLAAQPQRNTLRATVELAKPGAPREFQLTLRVPEKTALKRVTVNGHPSDPMGPRKETVVVKSESTKRFEIHAEYG